MLSLGDVWPLFDLTLRTPRLELHPVRDADLAGLADAALAGIHDAHRMPFAVPWTDVPREELPGNIARYHWWLRANVARNDWEIAFAIMLDGVVIGSQDVSAKQFSERRTVTTGSWLTRSAQGLGYGKEMRAAALMFAFDYLGADFAETSSASWNRASIGVTTSLGYEATERDDVADRTCGTAGEIHFRHAKNTMRRPPWELTVAGFEPVRNLLSAF